MHTYKHTYKHGYIGQLHVGTIDAYVYTILYVEVYNIWIGKENENLQTLGAALHHIRFCQPLLSGVHCERFQFRSASRPLAWNLQRRPYIQPVQLDTWSNTWK